MIYRGRGGEYIVGEYGGDVGVDMCGVGWVEEVVPEVGGKGPELVDSVVGMKHELYISDGTGYPILHAASRHQNKSLFLQQ